MEWQPIETAPKDGTKFAAQNDGVREDGEWFRCFWGTYYDPDLQREITDWLVDKWSDGQPVRLSFCRPTQWMPLPEPPK